MRFFTDYLLPVQEEKLARLLNSSVLFGLVTLILALQVAADRCVSCSFVTSQTKEWYISSNSPKERK